MTVRALPHVLLAAACAIAGWRCWSLRTPRARATPAVAGTWTGSRTAAASAMTSSARACEAGAPPCGVDTAIALRELEADIQAAAELDDADERWARLAKACLRWTDYDPLGALQRVHELGLDDTHRAILADVVQRWAGQNLAAALAWVTSRPPNAERDDMLARVAVAWSESQPTAAVRLVVEEMAPGLMQDEAGIAILHRWARQDFAAASAWVARFPLGDLRDRACAELVIVAAQPSS